MLQATTKTERASSAPAHNVLPRQRPKLWWPWRMLSSAAVAVGGLA
jgi:hypothetical protein